MEDEAPAYRWRIASGFHSIQDRNMDWTSGAKFGSPVQECAVPDYIRRSGHKDGMTGPNVNVVQQMLATRDDFLHTTALHRRNAQA